MKRVFSIIMLSALVCATGWSQAKKPTIMVVPSDAWCKANKYVITTVSDGDTIVSPDYQKALSNSDMRSVISAMADFMAKNDFPIQSLEQELKRIKNETAEMSVMSGKNSGASVVETPVERLRRTAKADIILDMDYTVKKTGARRQVSFNLQAIDAYSSKIISGNTGIGTDADVPMAALLNEAVLSFKDNFLSGLQHYFDDMFANGREITVTLVRYDTGSKVDFQTEYTYYGQDAELNEIIQTWMDDNAVNGRYTVSTNSANMMRFTQVRIPLYGQNLHGKDVAIDASGFIKPLVKMLKGDPYKLTVGTSPKGLGEIWLTIGDK